MFELKGSMDVVFDEYDNQGKVPDLWFDWFCKDHQLPKRGARMMKILSYARNHMKFQPVMNNKQDFYVFFKNNCPVVGRTYDQVSICEKGTGNVLFCIQDQVNKQRGIGVWVYSWFDDFAEDKAFNLSL